MEPLCGIYHKSLEAKFLLMQKDNSHKLGKLLKASNTSFILCDNEEKFLNLNHPHDYKQALKIISN